MSPESRLEPARLADAACIARMSRRLIEHGLEWRWTPRAIASRIQDAETEVVVARADDRIVAPVAEKRARSRAGGARVQNRSGP